MTSPAISQPPAEPVSAMAMVEQALVDTEGALSPIDRLIGMRIMMQGFCAMVRSLSVVSPDLFKALAPGIATFLSRDFMALIAEEDEGLLPHLRNRLLIGDELDSLMAHLGDEHRQDGELAQKLSMRCREFAAGTDIDWPDLYEALQNFAEQQRRHLVWEDATILPIARDRLKPDDLTRWDADMRRRYRLISCIDR